MSKTSLDKRKEKNLGLDPWTRQAYDGCYSNSMSTYLQTESSDGSGVVMGEGYRWGMVVLLGIMWEEDVRPMRVIISSDSSWA